MVKNLFNKNNLSFVSKWLIIVGAIVWGLIGFFNLNIVESYLNFGMLPRIIYSLVGIAGIYYIFSK